MEKRIGASNGMISMRILDFDADSPIITDLEFAGVASAEPTTLLFSLVAEDNSVTHYQVTITVADGGGSEEPSAGVITGTEENTELVSALENLGIGTKDESGSLFLTQQDIDNTTSLDLSEKGLTTVEGLEVFTHLTHLDCSNNKLTVLDFSKLTELVELNCSNCVGENTPQTRAIVANGVLDLSANTKLQSVECSQNGLTQLILPDVPNLTALYCSSNNLTSIDFSKQTNLNTLDIANNALTTLDVSANKELLRNLICGYNNLTELDVTLCTNLAALHCQGNQMSELNALHNTKLENLSCGGQQTASGEAQTLELILPESLMTLWETQWQNESMNENVIVSDGTLKPGASGEDFGNGGEEYIKIMEPPSTPPEGELKMAIVT